MESSSSISSSMDPPASKAPCQWRRGVRVVGKIRPLFDSEVVEGSDCDFSCSSKRSNISVTKFEADHALIAFGDPTTIRKDSYKLDWCYEQDEGVIEVFNGEVKPLIEGLFHGFNACVITYGARRSGKSQLIQGYEDNPGLLLVTVSKILAFANEIGGSMAISCYEASQDHIYDILEPKKQEVLLLEDAAKRLQLKGLSQVPVNSVSDFKRLYHQACNQRKSSQKSTTDAIIRWHRGLIVYFSRVDGESKKFLVGKMNFVDLAGYEDPKQKINARPQAAEVAKINKSLYTLLNVVYALNASESYVPYRESKLTRLLQDFLCRASRAVLITCLSATSCPDNIYVVNLASRSCQVVNQSRHDSAKVIKSGSRLLPLSSPLTEGIRASEISMKKNKFSRFVSTEQKGNGTPSATQIRHKPLDSSVKKEGGSLSGPFSKNTNVSSTLKGRKLFNATSPLSKNSKDNHLSTCVTAVDASGQVISELVSNNVNHSKSQEGEDINPKLDDCQVNEHSAGQKIDIVLDIDEKISVDYDNSKEEENKNSFISEGESSPPISERLKEISNSLKLLCTQSTNFETPKAVALCINENSKEIFEPKTPGVALDMRLERDSKFEHICTPQDILITRSTGLKKSLVQECLVFLNSANKEELKRLKGIGEKRANYILELREKTPELFKDINDLKKFGLTSKQINALMSSIIGDY